MIRANMLFFVTFAVTSAAVAVQDAAAQSFGISNSLRNNSFQRAQGIVNRYNPTNQILGRSTVSPYLRLANQSSAFQYEAVRNAIDNRQQSLRQSSQIQSLTTQVNSVSQTQANLQFGITGHPTRRMNYSHYFGYVRGVTAR